MEGSSRRTFCSTACRARGASARAVNVRAGERQAPRRLAVFNHKGGTGKTTTAINLAAGLAEAGKRVLLIDADGQGNVGAALGVHGQASLYHVLVLGTTLQDAAVPIRPRLDVLTADETLAAAELHLATRSQRDRRMQQRLASHDRDYDVVVIDCAPALSLLNQNALVYADQVVVPVSCDYLALIGVKQVLRTLQQVRSLLRHPIQLLGVLPTMYDRRQRLARDSLATLKENFGEGCLMPIRTAARLREAPMAKQSIFEYAPDSTGAEDYAVLVGQLDRLWRQVPQVKVPQVSVAAPSVKKPAVPPLSSASLQRSSTVPLLS